MYADWIRLMIAAARLQPRSDPANIQFERPSAMVVSGSQPGCCRCVSDSPNELRAASGSEVGHFTVITCPAMDSSMITDASAVV